MLPLLTEWFSKVLPPPPQWSLYSVATSALDRVWRGVAVVLPRCVSSHIVCGVCAVRHTDSQTDGQVVGECAC